MFRKILVLAGLAVLAGILIWIWNKGYFAREDQDYATKIYGDIQEIGRDYILIKGGVGVWDSRIISRPETRTIRFSVNSSTVYTKKAIIIPADIKPGDTFYPEVKNVSGSFSDLYLGLAVGVVAKENLFTKDKAKALEIIYEVIEK